MLGGLPCSFLPIILIQVRTDFPHCLVLMAVAIPESERDLSHPTDGNMLLMPALTCLPLCIDTSRLISFRHRAAESP